MRKYVIKSFDGAYLNQGGWSKSVDTEYIYTFNTKEEAEWFAGDIFGEGEWYKIEEIYIVVK